MNLSEKLMFGCIFSAACWDRKFRLIIGFVFRVELNYQNLLLAESECENQGKGINSFNKVVGSCEGSIIRLNG